jgi:raffinose/stachyose/melibiose transport system permease protein
MVPRREQLFSYSLLVVFSTIAVWPLLAVVLLAFNRPGSFPVGLGIPQPWSFDSFIKAWNEGGFGSAIINSVVVACAVVAASLFLSILTGYAFGTMRFRGSSLLFYYFLLGVIVPYEATVIPLYYDFRALGLIDTYWAMILPQVAFSVSFGTFWLRAFFRAFPSELIDAARVDGAGTWAVLWRVIVPNARPALLAAAVILFIWTWNILILAIVMMQSPNMQLAPAALAFFAGAARSQDLPVVGAAAVLVALPVVVMYVLLQRQYMASLVGGALKG